MCNSLQPHGLQHARLPCPSPTPRAYSHSCPSSRWCHRTISSSVIPFSSCLQSFPSSGSFPMSQFFTSGGQSTGAWALASVLPMNIQDWFPLGLTGLISLLSKGLSRVFSNTTVQKHQFFSAQPSLTAQLSMISQLVHLLSPVQLCDPMDCGTPGFPVHHQHLELAQTHVHRFSNAIQPSYPLSSPSPTALNLSQHQGLF